MDKIKKEINNKKDKRSNKLLLFLTVILLLGAIIPSITQIIVYAIDLDNRGPNLKQFNESGMEFKTQTQVFDAIRVIDQYQTRIKQLETRLEKTEPSKIFDRYDNSLDELIEYEINRVQMIAIKKALYKQLEEETRDKIILEDDNNTPISLSEEDLKKLIVTRDSMENSIPPIIQELYDKYIDYFSDCLEGLEVCGETTEDVTSKFVGWDDIVTQYRSSNIPISEIKDSAKESLKPIKQLLLASTDITWVTNLESDKLEDWLKKHSERVVKRLNLLIDLTEVYNAFGLEGEEVTSTMGIDKHIKATYEDLKKLCKSADLQLKTKLNWNDDEEKIEIDEEDKEVFTGKGLNKIADLVDIENQDISDQYKALISWTSSFTPFKTNLAEGDITDALSPQEETIFKNYGKNRALVYTAKGIKDVAKGLQTGIPTEVEPISLGEFLDSILEEEVVLFLESPDTLTKNKDKDAKMNTKGEIELEEEVPKQDIGKFLGENSISINKDEEEVKEEETERISENYPRLMGPIYASSGKNYKEIYGLDIAGDKSKSSLYGGDSKVFMTEETVGQDENIKEDIISKLKGNTMNMNYFLMHNILEEGYHLNDNIKKDLSFPIYADFLGNIVTHSGYVVVPASANYTYYNYSNRLPVFNAMFLKGYPKLEEDINGNFSETSITELNKLVYQKSINGGIEIGKLTDKGNKIHKEFEALPMWSKIPLPGSEQVVDFMNDVTAYKRVSDYFYANDKNPGSEGNYVFVNPGVKIRDRNSQALKYNNLKNIPENPKSIEWKLLKDLNYIFTAKSDTKMLDSYIMSGIASVVVESEEITKVDLTEYMPKADRFKISNKVISIFGELYEDLIRKNMFKGNSMQGISFGGESIFGDYPTILITLFIVISIIAAILVTFNTGINMLTGDFKEVKSMVISLLAIAVIFVVTINFTPNLVDMLFNKPSDIILKKQLPIVALNKAEDVGVGNNYFFSEDYKNTKPIGDSSITLEKLNKTDIMEIRKSMNRDEKVSDVFYFPKFDKQKLNVIADKVYLQGDELKIDTSDLLKAISITEVNQQGAISNKMKFNIEELGEISYYMPYFNIAESLTDTINRFSELSENSYTLKTYSNGETRSTGRVDEYFKSIVFIAPGEIETFIEDSIKQMQESSIMGENLVRDDIEAVFSEFIEDMRTTEKDPLNSEIFNPETDDEDSDFSEEELTDEEKENTKFLFKSKSEELTKNSKNPKIREQGTKFGKIEKRLFSGDQEEHLDWLGLQKVLLAKNNQTLFPSNRYEEIVTSKWYPESFLEFGYTEELDNKIIEVNERTKDFVLEKIVPISSSVSDENLIKIVSLYATMQFNEVFSEKETLYPRTIDVTSLPDEYIVSGVTVPQVITFKHPNKAITEYIVEQDGVVGITMSLLDRISYIIRKVVKEIMLLITLTLSPFILLYIYTRAQSKKGNYLKGLMITITGLFVMNIIEILSYVGLINALNSGGGKTVYYIIIVIRLILTILHILLIRIWSKDVKNAGYTGYLGTTSRVLASLNGMDYDTASSFSLYGGSYEGSFGGYDEDYTYEDYTDDFTLDDDLNYDIWDE